MDQIATFHTHFGALSFQRRLQGMGEQAVMMPVPRALAARCGTCARIEAPFCAADMADEDLDRVYAVEGTDYREIFQNEEE